MEKHGATLKVIGIAIVLALINLLALTQLKLAYGMYSWMRLAASYPVPHINRILLPIIQRLP